MSGKDHSNEDEYFAKEDIEKHRQARSRAGVQAGQGRSRCAQGPPLDKCPQCGNDLATIKVHSVDVSRCFHCHGTFLDEHSLKKLRTRRARGSTRSSALVKVFKTTGKH